METELTSVPDRLKLSPKPRRRRFRGRVWLRRASVAAQTLHIYGSLGIGAFGWGVCRLLSVDPHSWLPLWVLAGVLIFNIDRLRDDPADVVNTPRRWKSASNLRIWSWVAMVVAGVLLFAIPIRRGDWLTFYLTLAGGLVCANYTIPVFGFRSKNVPLLKTFFAPSIVMAAVIGLPLFHAPRSLPVITPLVVVWGWGLLFCNMMICDLRDVAGDRRFGIESVPSRIGRTRTRRLLWAIITASGGMAMVLGMVSAGHRSTWFLLAWGAWLYVGMLIWAVRKKRSEHFYEWWVEGILYLPAIALFLTGP